MSEVVVMSRYFTRHYAKDALPENTRTDTEPAYKVQLRVKEQREEKRRKRKHAGSPLSVPSKEREAVCPTP